MASPSFAPEPLSQKRLSLAEIDAVVSAKLGATRTLGNAQPACFNRQVAMYLAARVGRWSTAVIGRFYNGRDHSTVCHGIQRIEELRDSDPEVDVLLSELKAQLVKQSEPPQSIGPIASSGRKYQLNDEDLKRLANEVADRFADRIKELLKELRDRG
jgi:Bacterial dnaA protein helix-turn-helix